MSKVTMPDPSLYVLFDERGYPIEAHSDNSSAVDAALDAGGIVEIERYITTDQAEAYADARVREALEASIAICDAAYEQGKSEYRTSCNPYFEGGCDAAESIESKIRALIPPLPGPVEP